MSITPIATKKATPDRDDGQPDSADHQWRQWLDQDVELQPANSHGRLPDGQGRRALLISYMFPPTGGPAVQRPAKLVKYLPEFGWTTETITAWHDRFPWTDVSLLSDISAQPVHRVAGWEPACLAKRMTFFSGAHTGTDARGYALAGIGRQGRPPIQLFQDRIYWRLSSLTRRLGYHDDSELWINSAVRYARRLHRRNPFDVIITTGPPHFVHRVGAKLKRITRLPWIADVRDTFISDFDRGEPDPRRLQKLAEIEKIVLTQADRIITTCNALKSTLIAKYPKRRPDQITVITNGFDRGELRQALRQWTPDNRSAETCRLVVPGSFHGRRTVAPLLEAIERVLRRHPEWRDRIRLTIAGSIDTQQQRWLADHAPDWLEWLGYVDHRELLPIVAGAACSLNIVPDCDHGRNCIAGKTFELMALPVPVLGLVPDGSEMQRVIEEAAGAICVPFEDVAGVAAAIERVASDFFAGRSGLQRHFAIVDRYDRRSIAANYAATLDDMCDAVVLPTSVRPIKHHESDVIDPASDARPVISA